MTADFRPGISTPLGIDRVQKGGMNTVLLRHCPELAGLLPRGAGAVAPWRHVQPVTGGDGRAQG